METEVIAPAEENPPRATRNISRVCSTTSRICNPRGPVKEGAIGPAEVIQTRIFLLRGQKVMLDRHLAELYGVKPIRLREQVKGNKARFPEDFMFQLTDKETARLVSQFAIPSKKGFCIEYTDALANLRHYYPDFVLRLANGEHWLVETKGREDIEVKRKDEAAVTWCENATSLTGVSWNYLKVPQKEFEALNPGDFEELRRGLQ